MATNKRDLSAMDADQLTSRHVTKSDLVAEVKRLRTNNAMLATAHENANKETQFHDDAKVAEGWFVKTWLAHQWFRWFVVIAGILLVIFLTIKVSRWFDGGGREQNPYSEQQQLIDQMNRRLDSMQAADYQKDRATASLVKRQQAYIDSMEVVYSKKK